MIAARPLSLPTPSAMRLRAGDAEPITMNQCADRLPASRDVILRFVAAERLLHWAIAIPFLGCFISAAVLIVVYNPLLVVYNPDPTRAYRYIFAWMHRGCGVGLILCPSLVLLASARHWRIHLYNIRQAWVWRFDDIKWLALMGPAAISKRVVLPDQGKFNAAEKLNFMMVMVFPFLFIASGVLIWFPDSTKLGSFSPWIVHCGLVALATPLVCGHVIMATINPSTRVGLTGMVTGFVSREWAAHHYARWFREQYPDLAQEHAAGEQPHLQPAVDIAIAARPQEGGSAQPVEHESDCCDRTSEVADATADATTGIHEQGFVVDETEEVALRARHDGRAAIDAACEVTSPDAVTAGQ